MFTRSPEEIADRNALVDILLVRYQRATIDEQSAILARLVASSPFVMSDILTDVLDRNPDLGAEAEAGMNREWLAR